MLAALVLTGCDSEADVLGGIPDDEVTVEFTKCEINSFGLPAVTVEFRNESDDLKRYFADIYIESDVSTAEPEAEDQQANVYATTAVSSKEIEAGESEKVSMAGDSFYFFDRTDTSGASPPPEAFAADSAATCWVDELILRYDE